MEKRLDGRFAHQLRPPRVELRPLRRSDGSARFSMGGSSVLAAVYGPREAKMKSREVFDRAIYEVHVRPRSGPPGQPAERNIEAQLIRHMDHIVLATEYPRTQITVVVQIVSSDGAIGAVCQNAAFLALLDAGVAMRATVLCVAIGICGGEPLLDPTDMEEQECECILTLGADSTRGHLVSASPQGEGVNASTWANCAAAGSAACKVLEQFLRMSVQRKLGQFLKS
eukprot:gnl/MRDRNA2_/MRDRNA2_89555_c0_seq1.p1 gnl/MRDRNA2_/MRDRNA2_89555_c0~~gnl/MRDRNA2_/MRDRNA2_89555_c0_seq1.p1  ORF type:complete len:226 (-),score=36.87 gnl/MRDRNA2_/MRDRNA2_89555_c0_seq1:12-689(-)